MFSSFWLDDLNPNIIFFWLMALKSLCSPCSYPTVFSSVYKFKKHNATDCSDETLEEKKNESGLQCNICMKSFLLKSAFQQHQKRAHQPQENHFVCNICTISFSTIYSYRDHKLKKHQILLNCNECEKKFEKQSSLNEHMKTQISSSNVMFNNSYSRE